METMSTYVKGSNPNVSMSNLLQDSKLWRTTFKLNAGLWKKQTFFIYEVIKLIIRTHMFFLNKSLFMKTLMRAEAH